MADNRTMAQMLQAPIEGYEDAIVVPPINANNFELKQTLINLVQSEARTWLDKEPPRSILTWDDLVSKFINQFFPPSKTTYLRNEITTFLQKPNETFNEAWERFKGLLRQCPHHGFSELHQLDTIMRTEMKKNLIKRLVGKHVAKAIEEYEKSRANLDSAGSSGGNPGNAKMMTTEYCPATEIQRIEQELWTLTLKRDDIKVYNNRFHELALMCLELVPTEKKKIKRYTCGFPERIKGNITSSKPATHDAIKPPNFWGTVKLVEQAVQGKATRIGESNKRKWEDHQRNTNNNNNNPNNNNNNRNRNNNYHQQQNRRQETARAYAAAPTENRGYAGNLPKCNCCNFHHSGRCPPKCQKCQRTGHLEKDCRAILPGACNDFLQNATCYGCGEKGHLKNKCPKAGNQHNEGARARAYVVVENPQQNPNVVTGLMKGCVMTLGIRDFPEVFPDEFISSVRDVRLVEPLKVLQRKGFIRPSHSHLGSNQCYCLKKVEDNRRPRLEPNMALCVHSLQLGFEEYAPELFMDLIETVMEEHDVHTERRFLDLPILDLLKKEKLYAKFSKCEFWLKEVQFLGHVVNRDGIHVDPSKVESVKNRKTLESSTEIRSFLGLTGYYRRFIENFSKIAKPLTLLTQKNKTYVWGDEQDEAFRILKEKLCNAPVLALPDGPDDFVVYCDASK
ncbi:putative reverse transcriptase domain-containing protein [Tanacetum coccineum]|uniref:Reverse transcriptase domain-containing protein n=1 Tax=Tanacetum coccineum TaxID=301880 RepID=A0ABQ5ILR9_9ASTR